MIRQLVSARVLFFRPLVATLFLLGCAAFSMAANEATESKSDTAKPAANSKDEPAASKAPAAGATTAESKKAVGTDDPQGGTASAAGAQKTLPKAPPLINLNTATEAQLLTLPGITRSHAKRIIAGRPYESVDDLSRARIFAGTINKLRSRVSVSDTAVEHTVAKPVADEPQRIDLNTATEAQLQSVPEIGELFAKKVIAGRPYKSIDELSKTGLTAAAIAKIKPQVTVDGKVAKPTKGLVWVNRLSKIYHREGSQWYGKTRNGKYMPEAEAIKAGYVAAKRQ